MKRTFKVIGLILSCIVFSFSSNIMALEGVPTYNNGLEGIYITKSLSGIIDVYNMNGRGQLLYDDIVIENTGDFEVNVLLPRIKNESDSSISLTKSALQQSSSKKEVYMYLENISSGDGQRYTVAENIQGYNLGLLAPGEKMILIVGGEVNANCSTWNQSDVLRTTMEFVFEQVVPEIVQMPVIIEVVPGIVETPIIEDIVPEIVETPIVEDIVPEIVEDSVIEEIAPEIVEDSVIEEIAPEIVEDPVIEDIVPEIVEDPVIEELEDERIEEPITEELEGEIIEEVVIEVVIEEMVMGGFEEESLSYKD